MSRNRALEGAALAVALLALLHDADLRAESAPDAGGTTRLTYRAVEDWDIVLPEEKWQPLAGALSSIAVGGGFATERAGVMALEVDTDGDGETDTKVKGTESLVTLRGTGDDGQRFTYAVRIVNENGAFKWSSSGMMAGKLAGASFKVIDQNNNGVYGELGVDAMIVGTSRGASMLSRIVNVGDQLYEIELSDGGSTLAYTPWEGETGMIDATSDYECRGKLVAAIFESSDGRVSFNAASNQSAIRVPAGEYRLVSGFAEMGEETVEMRGGKMRPIQVDAREVEVLDWGGPIVAEFGYEVNGDTLTVPPEVGFYGAAGEEYTRFQPNAKSPKIVVLDSQTRKEVASGRFGGC